MKEHDTPVGATPESKGGVWLRHRRPEGLGHPGDMFVDFIEIRLEEVVAYVANTLRTRHGSSIEKSQRDAANLVMSAMLAVQSRYAPVGQVAMVHALVEHDPALAALREDFRATVRRHSLILAGMIVTGVSIAAGLAAYVLG